MQTENTAPTSRNPQLTGAVALPSRTGFRRILVCLDRSEAAEAVLPLATHIAQMDRANLILLHVLEVRSDDAGGRATDALEWEIAREETRSYLDGLTSRIGALSVAAESLIAEGSVAQGVTASAAELEADLVVLSRYGQGGADASALGGSAQKILAVAHAAVLVIPSPTRHPAPHVPPHRILVPLDGSLRSESALPTAVRLARADGAEIVLAHIVPDPIRTEVLSTPEDLALAQELADRLARRAEAYLERIRSQLVAAGVSVHAAARRADDHREGLAALVASERIDLVAMAAHGSVCNPKRPFGSVTSYLLAHAAAPVLVVQDLPGRAGGLAAAQRSRLPPRSRDAAPGGA